MNKNSFITLTVVVTILVIVGAVTYIAYITPNDDAHSDAKAALEASPEKIFTDIDGNVVDFTSHEGKVRVVETWASWSPFSTSDLQVLNEVIAEYPNEKVIALAINRKEPKEQAQRFLNTLPPLTNISIVIDQSDSFYTTVGGYAMPETIFYDNRGNITFHKRGSLTKEELKLHIEEAINTQE